MNNKGFGLTNLLFFSLIFMLFLLACVYLINVNYRNTIKTNKIKDEQEITYYDIEIKLVNSARKYMKNNYPNLKEDIEIPIKLDTLIENNYIAPIKDLKTFNECNGYVLFSIKNNNIEYNPYIKCDNYITVGYQNNLD